MARKLSAPQFRLLSAMATDGSDGRRGYLLARPTVTTGTAAACVSAGWMVWDTLDKEVAHQITDAGREAVAAYVSGGNRELPAEPAPVAPEPAAAPAIVTGSLVLVSADWLRTCGMQRFEGQAFEVVGRRDFGSRGVMFDLAMPGSYLWTVWDVRGVEPFVPPAPAMLAQPAQLQQAQAGALQPIAVAAEVIDRPCSFQLASGDFVRVDPADLASLDAAEQAIQEHARRMGIDGRIMFTVARRQLGDIAATRAALVPMVPQQAQLQQARDARPTSDKARVFAGCFYASGNRGKTVRALGNGGGFMARGFYFQDPKHGSVGPYPTKADVYVELVSRRARAAVANGRAVPTPAQQQQARATSQQAETRPEFPAIQETADDRDAANIAKAATFTASIRAGGKMQTIRDLRTMSEAGASALIMERSAGNGRQGIVYAVTAEGRSAMVKRSIWEAEVGRALRALA